MFELLSQFLPATNFAVIKVLFRITLAILDSIAVYCFSKLFSDSVKARHISGIYLIVIFAINCAYSAVGVF